ncbi:hypothetical protein ACIQF6_19900 [Kitasatospora sp. NPDC092948]|uniref:hypothetical protein n=1 Tax=Kitasatospora sp. NPDC092948 TaxID=3364088 RepID=UPI0037FAFE57
MPLKPSSKLTREPDPEESMLAAQPQAKRRRRSSGQLGAMASAQAGPSSEAVGDPFEAGAYEKPSAIVGQKKGISRKGRADELENIVWKDHWEPISEVCRRYNYTICVRETGALSIARIAEGAKAKPHTILEKTIKKSSLAVKYKDDPAVMEKLESLELTGFVGHWDPEGGLLGVRIDNPPGSVAKSLVRSGRGGEPYVPVDVHAEGGGSDLLRLKEDPEWKHHLYTGDYDLHEVYKVRGLGGGGQIPEATPEKVNLLNRLNRAIAAQDEKSGSSPVRSGTSEMGAGGTGTIHMAEGSSHAMFQHGDQATYRMNQYFEHGARVPRDPKESPTPRSAKLVKAVATESDEPLAWCRFGHWYVTRNSKEHAALRKRWKLTTPHTWEAGEVKRTAEGKYLTAEFLGGNSARRREPFRRPAGPAGPARPGAQE